MADKCFVYHINCETEGQYVEAFGKVPPTKCPNDTAHTVTANSAQKLREYSAISTKIIEHEHDPATEVAIAGYKQILSVELRNDLNPVGDNSLNGKTVNKMVWMSPPDPIIIHSIHAQRVAASKRRHSQPVGQQGADNWRHRGYGRAGRHIGCGFSDTRGRCIVALHWL